MSSWFSFGTKEHLEKAQNKGLTKKEAEVLNAELKLQVRKCSRDISKLIADLKHEIKIDTVRSNTEFIAVKNYIKTGKMDLAREHTTIIARHSVKIKRQTKLLVLANSMSSKLPQMKNQQAIDEITQQLLDIFQRANAISNRISTPQIAIDYAREQSRFNHQQEMLNETLNNIQNEEDEEFIETEEDDVISFQQLSQGILQMAITNKDLDMASLLSTSICTKPIGTVAKEDEACSSSSGEVKGLHTNEEVNFIVESELRLAELRSKGKKP